MNSLLLKLSVAAFVVTLISSCATSNTSITGSYKRPEANSKNYKSLFVSAMTNNVSAKESVEKGLETALEERGLNVETSIERFPPNFESQNSSNKDSLLNRIRVTDADAILTISLLDTDTEQRYVPGSGAYNPTLRYGWYGNYWGYYSGRYSGLYSPGYYTEEKVYYLETNLYDAATEQLVWSAQSKTYNPSDINQFLKGYINSVYEKMQQDGVVAASSADKQ